MKMVVWILSLGAAYGAEVEPQPFLAASGRLMEAMSLLGTPVTDDECGVLRTGMARNDETGVEMVMKVLDAHSLFHVTITPEQRVKVERGGARPELNEAGWRQYLVRVVNEAGVTARLSVTSPEAKEMYVKGSPPVAPHAKPVDPGLPAISARWLDCQMFDSPPLQAGLSGLGVEYRVIQLYSRDVGKRDATFSFDVGQGTQDLGFRNETSILFDCMAARKVSLDIKDEEGKPCVAELLIRDDVGRIYPSQIKRQAPDFFFHPQVYRGDGEWIKLPDGEYEVTFRRGPESVPETRRVRVDGEDVAWNFRVKRWVDPSKLGWWSGDHHIHAAGCAHYSVPSQGVHATDMARHCQGEDLKIGANLTWGPCFDYQK